MYGNKGMAIICYFISGFFAYMEIARISRGIPLAFKVDIFVISLSAVFLLIGLKNHGKHRRLRNAYGELIDGKNVERIDYMIKDHKFYKGGDCYVLEFYIDGKRFELNATKMSCRNNKNNEYYLTPVYDRKGRFKDFIGYMDRENVDHKYASYRRDLEHYREMERLKEGTAEKENKPVKPKYTGPKTASIPKIKSKRMKKKYEKNND